MRRGADLVELQPKPCRVSGAWPPPPPIPPGSLWFRCGSLRWHVLSRDRSDGRSWNTLAATPNTCVSIQVTPRCNAAERNASTLHLQPSRQSLTHTGSTTNYTASVFLSSRNEVFIKRMENSQPKHNNYSPREIYCIKLLPEAVEVDNQSL